MYQSGLRSLSFLLMFFLLSATPAFSILMSASELCEAEGCKLGEQVCLCPRDLESVRHSLETKAAKAHRVEARGSTPYLAFVLGSLTCAVAGVAILANGEKKDGILSPRSSVSAMLITVSSIFGYNAVSILRHS